MLLFRLKASEYVNADALAAPNLAAFVLSRRQHDSCFRPALRLSELNCLVCFELAVDLLSPRVENIDHVPFLHHLCQFVWCYALHLEVSVAGLAQKEQLL